MKAALSVVVFMCLLHAVCAQVVTTAFVRGHYLDKEGRSHEGFIYYKKGGLNPHIRFKVNDSDDDFKKIFPSECKEFVVDSTRRFVSKKMFKIYAGNIPSDFVEVIADGSIGLFRHLTISTEPDGVSALAGPAVRRKVVDVETLLVAKKGNNELTHLDVNQKKLKKVLSDFFSEDKEMSQRVTTMDKISEQDIIYLVEEYNKKHI